MRPHLVRINSTIVDQAPFVFNTILIIEICLCIIVLVISPLFCAAAIRTGSIHRNFRCQVCLASFVYSLGIFARFVLIYYQIYDIPLTDYDPVLLFADLLRDTVIGYFCGLSGAFIFQILIGTVYWKWYEQNNCTTVFVILISETVNFTLSFLNASIWLLDYTPFIMNIGYLLIMTTSSVSGFFYTYIKNAHQLDSLTKSRISHTSYTVGRSFQIRENVLLMKYIVQCIVPAAVFSSPCFICFAYNAYGPQEWQLSRSIAYAIWDLFFVIFYVIYLYRQITKHPLIYREFKNLGVVQLLRRQAVHASEVSSIAKIDISPTQTYFDQFKEAWK